MQIDGSANQPNANSAKSRDSHSAVNATLKKFLGREEPGGPIDAAELSRLEEAIRHDYAESKLAAAAAAGSGGAKPSPPLDARQAAQLAAQIAGQIVSRSKRAAGAQANVDPLRGLSSVAK